jgi:hypothetical protein
LILPYPWPPHETRGGFRLFCCCDDGSGTGRHQWTPHGVYNTVQDAQLHCSSESSKPGCMLGYCQIMPYPGDIGGDTCP